MSAKVYAITTTRSSGRTSVQTGTLAELIECYSYTLESGASYSHEKGNSKICVEPKDIKSLVRNLCKSETNLAANRVAKNHYTAREVHSVTQ